ncbi:hypothetical protein EUBSIR_02688 [[Eubacterium] siraeum DSM 15702]|uniref:Uncharacterized protein n=1 Tax=[Eubacterium] siraeum DSM 15702 TaxID=428128 RepID=B0MS51_9FIRM|nr:hypothetical protein EUBSIR_02688 [[Eubacterium] siraeum DSM 15702]UWP26063.1 hypothetical protein NQ549_04270 [[Eubacterium] siraeum]
MKKERIQQRGIGNISGPLLQFKEVHIMFGDFYSLVRLFFYHGNSVSDERDAYCYNFTDISYWY